MKNIITLILCLVLSVSPRLVKAQNCHAGTISALKDTVCQGIPVTLKVTGSSGNIRWQEATGDTFGIIAGAVDSTYRTVPLTQTTYFRVVVSNGSCSDTSGQIKIFIPPTINDSFQTALTDTTTVTFDTIGSLQNVLSYTWYFGDGDTSNELEPTHVYKKDSSYYACLTVRDSFGCSYTYCKYDLFQVGKFPSCSAVFSYTHSNDTVYFNSLGTVNADNYIWDFGDGNIGNYGPNPSHVYDSVGNYSVCLSIEYLHFLCSAGICHSVFVSTTNAVQSVFPNEQSLTIYPNPCTDCQVRGIENSTDIIVTDILGQVIPFSLTKSSNGYLLNMPNNQTGFFLVKNMKTGEVVKFVRE